MRHEARVEVRFSTADDAERALRAFSVNLSAGGLCLRTRREYPVGTALSLALTISGEEFALRGIVAWARRGVVGVRFDEVSPATQRRLADLLPTLRGD